MGYELWFGVAKVDITPEVPVPLAGFAFRSGPYEGITRSLYAKVSLFQQKAAADQPVATTLVVQADLIALAAEEIPGFAAEIEQRYGLSGASVIYNATHTHSGPHMRGGAASSKVNRDYSKLVESRLLQAVEQAFASLESVKVEKVVGNCSIGIHRRKEVNGEFVMAPNPAGPNDQEVTVIRFNRITDGTTKGIFVHFTCHPTTTGDNLISSEYPGVAMERVEQSLGGGAIATFLQGCCGDIRPNLTSSDGQFFRGDDSDVCRLGAALGDAVLAALKQEPQSLPLCALEVRDVTIRLPYQSVPDEATLREGAELPGYDGELNRAWLAQSAEDRNFMPMRLAYMKLAEGLELVALNGEVVVQYGLYLKQQFPDAVLPLAYSNGVVAYIPTAAQLIEGGYEARDSIKLFGMPSPFRRDIEALIRDAAVGLVRGKNE
ncbi:MAG: hypothetical protein K0R67_3957 [Paenibacillus sp.]|nr:hypothetical protein [Paenibacillus sp.]